MIVEIIKRDGCHSTVRMTIEVKGCGSRHLLFESKEAAKSAVEFIAECVGEKLEHKDDECSIALNEKYSVLRPGDEYYY